MTATSGTSVSHSTPPRLMVHQGKEGRKSKRQTEVMEDQTNAVLWKGQDLCTHELTADVGACTRLAQDRASQYAARWVEGPTILHPQWRHPRELVASGRSVFFKGVAPGRSHICEYTGTNWNPWAREKKR